MTAVGVARLTSDDLQLAGGQRGLGQSVFLLLGGHSSDATVLERFRAPDHDGQVLGELGVSLGSLQLVPLLLLHPDPPTEVHLHRGGGVFIVATALSGHVLKWFIFID